MISNKYVHTLIILFLAITLSSCGDSNHYLPSKSLDSLHYDVIHIDKEKKKKNYKQSYKIVVNDKDKLKVLRNDGKLISYSIKKNEIQLDDVDYIFEGLINLPDEKLRYEKKNIVLKFPLRKGENWVTNDLTTLIMKMGYDRIFQTLLPIEIENQIISLDEDIKIDEVLLKKCVLVVGIAKTSYNPGPPLDNINITVEIKRWYAPGFGLVKMTREEHSDSETMGSVFYEKTINF